MRLRLFPVLTLSIIAAFGQAQDLAADVNWPTFRGRHAAGVVEQFPLPIGWDVKKGHGIAWQTEIPGLGHSSPIVWEDRIFVTTAANLSQDPNLKVGIYGDVKPADEAVEHEWRVLCLDKKTGKILWTKTAHRGIPKIKRHPKSSHANSTPASDGQRVIAFFGSEGLYAYSMEGDLLWEKDFGVLDSGFYKLPSAQWGFASSPILDEGKVFVQCDVQKGSFVAAFDAQDGKELWRTSRDEIPTWCSPTVVRADQIAQLALNGFKQIAGYDIQTGALLWTMKGLADIPVPSPIFGHGLIFIAGAHGSAAPIYAIRPEAKGNISLENGMTSNAYVAWSDAMNGAYMQTPLLYRDHLYNCTDNGQITCYQPEDGQVVSELALKPPSSFSASGVAGDGKIYFSSEKGQIYVVEAGPPLKAVAVIEVGDPCLATPAISEGCLIVRTQRDVMEIKGE